MFVNNLVGELLYKDDHELLKDYHKVNYFLNCLKDSIWLMKKENSPEDPTTAFRQTDPRGRYDDIKARMKILGIFHSTTYRDKEKTKNLIGRMMDELKADGYDD